MQLTDLRKPLSEMTNEELKEELIRVRRSREVTRPAMQARKAKAARTSKAVTGKAKQLEKMSPEQLQLLIENLQKRIDNEG